MGVFWCEIVFLLSGLFAGLVACIYKNSAGVLLLSLWPRVSIFFSVFSKTFYVRMLVWLNVLGGEFFFVWAICLLVLGQYFYAVLVCLIYALVLHEFSFFSLVIGF